jgi:hypothetical protein
MMGDIVGHAAQQEARKTAQSPAAHHNQVRVMLLCILHDRLFRRSLLLLHGPVHPRLFCGLPDLVPNRLPQPVGSSPGIYLPQRVFLPFDDGEGGEGFDHIQRRQRGGELLRRLYGSPCGSRGLFRAVGGQEDVAKPLPVTGRILFDVSLRTRSLVRAGSPL